MTMYSNIPNLINGVSQAAQDKRFPSQVTEQENAMSSAVTGLGKRPPTQNVKQTSVSSLTDSWHYPIDRDGQERYICSVSGGLNPEVTIVDLEGTPATVLGPGGVALSDAHKAYLASANAATDLRAVTIGDYTIVSNRAKTPALGGEYSEIRYPEALLFVQRVTADHIYAVYINDINGSHSTVSASYTAVSGDTQEDVLTSLAGNLVGAINTYAPGQYAVNYANVSNALYITRTSTTDFTIQADSETDGAMTALKDRTEALSDLPSRGYRGFKIEIQGEADSTESSYWVEYAPSTTGDPQLWPNGYWKETVAPGIIVDLADYTMPHAFVNVSEGVFWFQPIDWTKRLAGDDISNSAPSFIGKPIRNVFFWRNRLGLLAGQNILMSESSEFFNFWRTSALQVLDTDVIDVASPVTGIVTLDSAVPRDEDLLVFSRDTQMVVSTTSGLLSPAQIRIDVATTYDTQDVEARMLGRKVYFGSVRGNYSGLNEYQRSRDLESYEASPLTNHVPQYIAGDIRQIEGLPSERLILIRSSGFTGGLYVYQYLDRGTERLQASWSKWTFGDNVEVYSVHVFDNYAYLLLGRTGGTWLERIDLTQGSFDTNTDFVTAVDRRVTEADVNTMTYSGATGNTTFNLPYVPTGTIQVATRYTSSFNGGQVLSSVTSSGAQVTIPGDYSTTPLWIGEQYTLRMVMTRPFMYQDSRAITQGVFKVRYGEIQYSNTAHFKVEVTSTTKTTSTYRFAGRTLGGYDALINTSAQRQDGKFRVPVFDDSRYVEVTLLNDSPMPCNLTQLTWEGKLRTR